MSANRFAVNGQYCDDCHEAWLALGADERRTINHRLYVLILDEGTEAIRLAPFTRDKRTMRCAASDSRDAQAADGLR
jgi:hypothetical protein